MKTLTPRHDILPKWHNVTCISSTWEIFLPQKLNRSLDRVLDLPTSFKEMKRLDKYDEHPMEGMRTPEAKSECTNSTGQIT